MSNTANRNQATQPEDDLTAEVDKILERVTADLRKKLVTLISRREKKLMKSTAPSHKASARKPADGKSKKKYHSSGSESDSS